MMLERACMMFNATACKTTLTLQHPTLLVAARPGIALMHDDGFRGAGRMAERSER